jgi:hypothetical protein
MLMEKAIERKSQPQMKKKGKALLAGFFPQYIHVKKFNIEDNLQNRVKNAIFYSMCPQNRGRERLHE